jgi:4-oxalocrotonate tautomerase
MPYINVRLLGRATKEQKRAVVADLTQSMVKRLGKSPEHIHIVIDEVRAGNWGYAGRLTEDFVGRERRTDRARTDERH